MSWVLHKIHHRLHEDNKNYIAVICGATGTGKSFCALRIGERLDPTFNISRVCFGAQEFLELLNSGTLKTGSVVILDEAGVGLPARQWYDICNKSVNYVLQTFRRENIALIMTTPSLSFLDVQARILSHAYIETQRIDRKRKLVLVKFKEIQHNPQMAKNYYKYYRKGRTALKKTWISLPSPEIIKDYEQKKKVFARKLYIEAGESIKKIEVVKQRPDEIISEVLKNPTNYMRKWQGKNIIDLDLITEKFSMGRYTAMKIKKKLEKEYAEFLKGVVLE